MYIPRNIDSELIRWAKSGRHKPLLLRGVRQCGKTTAVRNLAKSFGDYIEINLEREPDLCRIFEGDLDLKRIINRIELHVSKRITPETLLFIDEIQECPRAVTALRYFYEEKPELYVIAAGSLLEFVLNGGGRKVTVDFPVGRVRSLFMYPFSFMEFLTGTGNQILADYLRNLQINVDQNDAHSRLLELYKTFLIVGGMPEAVAEYASSGSIFECQQIHRDIIINFKDDFAKYSDRVPQDIIRRVFDFAMHNVCRQVKASSAIAGVSAYYFNICIELLRKAGLVFPVKASTCNALPLGATEKEANKKLLVFDTGIYLTECGLDAAGILGAEVFQDMNKGDVVEMATGLEILKNVNSYSEAALFYWYRSGANAEIDYAITLKNEIIPCEVKSSGKGSMQSLHSFLGTHRSPYGVRLSMEDFAEYENIHVYPVYAVSRLVKG